MSSVNDVLLGLTPIQREAAQQEGAVVVLAGAGTGKTSTLVGGVVDRIERRGIPPHRILAVTFTNKAAQEMRDRIGFALGRERSPAWIGTFHAHGCRQLRTDPEIALLRPGFDICDAEDSRRIVRRLMIRATEDGALEPVPGEELRKRVKSVTNRIAMFKDDLVLPDQALALVDTFKARHGTGEVEDTMAWELAAGLYPVYQAILRETNTADFGDLLLWPTITMLRDEKYRQDWAGRFDAVLADEFQDVNRLQFLWLKLLSRDHQEFFAVGDDAQSIYGWRGANVGFIRNFLQEFPDGRMIALEENFRSTGHILEAANTVIAGDKNRLEKTLFTSEGSGEKLEIIACSGGIEEAQAIAAEMGRRALEGVRYEDMAVLYRFNFMSRILEEELLQAKIPYELVNDTAFWQRAAIKDALAFLRLADAPEEAQSNEAFRRVINTPARGIGARSLAKFEAFAEEQNVSLFVAAEQIMGQSSSKAAEKVRAFLQVIREEELTSELSLAERMRTLLERSGYMDMHRQAGEDGRATLENLDELFGLAADFTAIEDLFEHAALGSAPAGSTVLGRVKLMTIHASKGLEFPHVFLLGWEEQLFPSANGDQDEERRLAYVALTRGRRRIAVTWCAFRNGRQSQPSPYLMELPKQVWTKGWLRNAGKKRHYSQAERAALDAALGL
ncbi:MAG: UvrD-helicase domain-containing protein [Acetobacter syzygii]|uniref:ATP-dependent helicase n=1 Tax=Acetobacter syzygii TaxID=146476 RepID=UPI0039E8BFBF